MARIDRDVVVEKEAVAHNQCALASARPRVTRPVVHDAQIWNGQ